MNTMLSWIDLTVVITYMAMMLGVGFYVYHKAPSFEEFVVAGRLMTTPVLVCTLASTYYGLEDLFGTSEFAYNDGVVAYFGYSGLSLSIFLFAALSLFALGRVCEVTFGISTPGSTPWRCLSAPSSSSPVFYGTCVVS